MKGLLAIVFMVALPLPSAEGGYDRPSVASSRALAIFGVLIFKSGCGFIEGRPPHHTPPLSTPPPPSPPTPSPPPLSTTDNCTQFPHVVEGPYWIEESIEASNVRLNVSYGLPLNLTLKFANATLSELQGRCIPIEQARIDIWHSRYDGLYSDEEVESTSGETWLRGYQYTNSTGHVTFYTIFPGWYPNRTAHIHIRIRVYEADGITASYNDTTQLYFDDTVSTAIYTSVYPYNIRGMADTLNRNDSYFTASTVLTLSGSYSDPDGYCSAAELSLPLSYDSSITQANIDERHGNVSRGGIPAILIS